MVGETVNLNINVKGGDTAVHDTEKLNTGMIDLAAAFYLAERAAMSFISVLDQTVGVAADLEKEIAAMGAIVGETTDNFNTFTETVRSAAIEMSVSYPVAATEVVRGMIGIAQAGFDMADTIEMSTHIMALSIATNGDFADSAKVVVNAMMSMRMGVEDTEHLTNVFQYAVNKSRNTMEGLAQSLKFVTGIAHTFGITVEDLVSAQMILVNTGTEAGIAGRTLQSMLMDIIRPSQQAKKVINELGLNFARADGTLKDFVGISEELTRVFGTETLTLEEGAQMGTIFGQQAARVVAALRGMAEEMRIHRTNMENDLIPATEQASFAMLSLSSMIGVVRNAFMIPFLQDSFLGPLKGVLIENIDKIQEFSLMLSEGLMQVMIALIPLVETILDMMIRNQEGFALWAQIIVISAQALTIMVRVLNIFGGQGIKILTLIYLMSKAYQLMTSQLIMGIIVKIQDIHATVLKTQAEASENFMLIALMQANMSYSASLIQVIKLKVAAAGATMIMVGAMGGAILAFLFWDDFAKKMGGTLKWLIPIIIAVTAAIVAFRTASGTGLHVAATTVAASAITFAGMGALMERSGAFNKLEVPEGPTQEELATFQDRISKSEAEILKMQTQNEEMFGNQYARGFHGFVNRPTPIIVGEAGAERVDITPRSEGVNVGTDLGGSSGGSGNVTNIYITDVSNGEVTREVLRQQYAGLGQSSLRG